MTLISSISGIRGTVNGINGSNLTPVEVVKYTSAYGTWINKKNSKSNNSIVIARDGRISGSTLKEIVKSTLISMGINVIDIDLSTTPTTQIIVQQKNANGGIILTASHNPKNWNALKLFNSKGEFLIKDEAEEIFNIVQNDIFNFKNEDDYGKIFYEKNAFKAHINEVINLKLVNQKNILRKKFKIVVDGINSSGGVIVPMLLKELGAEVIELNCRPDGNFSHNPEPLDINLSDLKQTVMKENADLGIALDPDVDRLVFVCENGLLFGEENTLVACSDYVLSKTKGSTVSNMSSSMSMDIITKKHGCNYYSSKVGEINVVEKMKEVNAIIGGEGNGGVIYPDSHYGRDALVGIVLFLSHLSELNINASELLDLYPKFFMIKDKINLNDNFNFKKFNDKIKSHYSKNKVDERDGIKIIFKKSWLHIRKSNTEPIIRIYSEAETKLDCEKIIKEFKSLI
jgi:phosphomannomutase